MLDRAHDPFGDQGDCGDASDTPAGALALDSAGQVWDADLGSLVRVTAAPGVSPGPLTAVLPNRGVDGITHAITTAADGTIWIATDRAFLRARPGHPPRLATRYHGSGIVDIAAGRRGVLWFTDASSRVGELTAGDRIRLRTSRLAPGAGLAGIATDAHGDPWFVEDALHRIGHLTRGGRVVSVAGGIPRHSRLLDIAPGRAGVMWFTDQDGRIGRISSRGTVRMFRSGPSRHRAPVAITRGADGAMWFTDFRGHVSRIDAHGRVRDEYTVPEEAPTAITSGRDGALWFTTTQSQFSSGLGRLSMNGHLSLYDVRHTWDTIPWGITAAADGSLWFSETHGPIGVGRFDPGAAP